MANAGANSKPHAYERANRKVKASWVIHAQTGACINTPRIHEPAAGADAAVPRPGAGGLIPESPLFEHATQANASTAALKHMIHLPDMIYLR